MSTLTSTRGTAMLSYLPAYYETSRIMKSVLQAQGGEMDLVREALDDTLKQFFVQTATWGLDRWEQELGLAVAPEQPVGERRDKITSRLRGYGTATLSIVKKVAESYQNGTIDPIEDFAAYTVTIKFVDTAGVPANLGDVQAALRAVIPAHLDVTYEFNYFVWNELDAHNWTWDQFDAFGLTWDQWEVFQ